MEKLHINYINDENFQEVMMTIIHNINELIDVVNTMNETNNHTDEAISCIKEDVKKICENLNCIKWQ